MAAKAIADFVEVNQTPDDPTWNTKLTAALQTTNAALHGADESGVNLVLCKKNIFMK